MHALSILLVSLATAAPGDAEGFADIPIDILNTWQAPYASQILDLSFVTFGGNIAFRSTADGKIFFADPDDGSYEGEMPLPDNCTGFGLEIYDESEYFVTDTSDGKIRHGPGGPGGWNMFDNPAAPADGGLAWSYYGMGQSMAEGASSSSDQFYLFDLYGGNVETYALPGITGTVSGIAAHEVMTLGYDYAPFALVVTCSDNPTFYFYWLYGGQYIQYGEETCPVSVQQSLGIEFMPDRQTFFWSYKASDGEYYVSELYIPILGALDEATWAEIKARIAD